MGLIRFFRTPGMASAAAAALLGRARRHVAGDLRAIETEVCFNVDSGAEPGAELDAEEVRVLTWLLSETFEPDQFGRESFLEPAPTPPASAGTATVLEVGPRLNFSTAWSTNAVSICHACGLDRIRRIERSRRYRLLADTPLVDEQIDAFLPLLHDRMTECVYPEPLESFATGIAPERVIEVPVLAEGRAALERINDEMGLAFDDWDLDYYTRLFRERMGRNPTNVECFDIAQSNSEHSRHWFFKGRLIIDGQEAPLDLMSLVRASLDANPNNSTIAFRDNSSAIRGYRMRTIVPAEVGTPSPMVTAVVDYDVIFTAETHNFPSGVAPFPGAETGTGGRIRDGHATGRGSLVVAGTAA